MCFTCKGPYRRLQSSTDLTIQVEKPYSRSPKVENPIASILKSNVKGIPALFGLNPVSNFMGFTLNPETLKP